MGEKFGEFRENEPQPQESKPKRDYAKEIEEQSKKTTEEMNKVIARQEYEKAKKRREEMGLPPHSPEEDDKLRKRFKLDD